jgi:hypothetical protein
MHSQDLSVPTDSRESGVAACFAFVRLFLFLFLLWHLLLRSYSRFKRKCEFVQMKILFSPQTRQMRDVMRGGGGGRVGLHLAVSSWSEVLHAVLSWESSPVCSDQAGARGGVVRSSHPPAHTHV